MHLGQDGHFFGLHLHGRLVSLRHRPCSDITDAKGRCYVDTHVILHMENY